MNQHMEKKNHSMVLGTRTIRHPGTYIANIGTRLRRSSFPSCLKTSANPVVKPQNPKTPRGVTFLSHLQFCDLFILFARVFFPPRNSQVLNKL